MRFTVVIATFLASIAVAMPDNVAGDLPFPCTMTDCGEKGKICSLGYNCVAWPSSKPSKIKGCTCSEG